MSSGVKTHASFDVKCIPAAVLAIWGCTHGRVPGGAGKRSGILARADLGHGAGGDEAGDGEEADEPERNHFL